MEAKEFKKALDAIVKEKDLDLEIVLDAMKTALATAYKKNFNEQADIRVSISEDTGEIRVCKVTTVVETLEGVENIESVISLEEAEELGEGYKVGDEIVEEVTPEDFGRVAVSVAKQVVMQKIREAERNNIMEEFQDKENELMIGFLAMEDVRNYYVDLGKARAILPKSEIIPGETLVMGNSVKVYITKIETTPKGPLILSSRKHYGFVKRLFESEVPELADGTLIMHAVAREAGVRSKVAISSTNSRVDAIGSCIGEKGQRIANIINELGGEKVDLILYSDVPEEYIASALSPAKNVNVTIIDDKKNKEALAIADDENLSLAIGKKGINIKLASKLTKYKINIKTLKEINEEINK
ncbi:MAG: transcription termination/antitermination protein NusA [Bacilli bacterium]|nr:transcription termination/antitermination protein NusA [Bacilli bacterium]